MRKYPHRSWSYTASGRLPSGKRLFDVLVSVALLPLVSPLLALVAVGVYGSMGAPVLFRQRRPGLQGRPFMLVKFRTMRNAVDATGTQLSDAQRLSGFGRLLRASSIDELPQLWNVLRGDMSLVGPRPLLMEYLPRYTTFEARRHAVRPGITGWAQVNGRNAVSWNERFANDVWYVEHRSFALDVRIMVLTALRVVRRDGISAKGEATMHPFTGHS